MAAVHPPSIRRPSAAGTRPVMDVLGPAVDTSDPTKTEIGPDRVTFNITNRNNANISPFVMDGIAATAVHPAESIAGIVGDTVIR